MGQVFGIGIGRFEVLTVALLKIQVFRLESHLSSEVFAVVFLRIPIF
jgi:hypothetical protein